MIYFITIIKTILFIFSTIILTPFAIVSWCIGSIYYVFKRRANN